MTSASRSSIFVESGSSLWRLTSNRSVLAASSGCFTSTDMIVLPQSTAQFAVVSRLKRALQGTRQSNPWSKALWDAQKLGRDSLAWYSIFLHILSILRGPIRNASGHEKDRVNRPEHSTVLFQSHAGILDRGKRPLDKTENKAIPLWEID